jgi:hypothetical protein
MSRTVTLLVAEHMVTVRQSPVPTVTVAIVSPQAGSTLGAPATFSIQADATAVNGSIALVEFFAGSTLLGTDTAAPYQISWPNVGVGTYTLTARATEGAGGTVTSEPVAVTVSPKLAPPIATPSAGTFATSQSVVLSSFDDGVAIHYTTDGTDPTAASAPYFAPISVSVSQTIKARAFKGGWAASDVSSQQYQVEDHTAPTISVQYSPGLNTAGWNNVPVTATFICADDNSGMATCPQPILFELEGIGQSVTVTATDQAGNQGSAIATVSIGQTAPSVTLAGPADRRRRINRLSK